MSDALHAHLSQLSIRQGRYAHTERTRASGSRLALCLWMPTFELRLELARTPELDSTSVALLSPREGARREIWQVSERAAEAGVRPGMLVSKAVGLSPSLTLLEPDPAHYDAAMEEMMEALSAVSPVLEPAGRGRIYLGMDGLGRLYGAPEYQATRALRALLQVLPRPLVAALRVGWAPGRFGAWVAAVSADPGRPRIVREEELVGFLARCPVSALPLEPLTLERLDRLAIGTLGELCALPESALVAQFGEDGANAHAWGTGRRIDPVRPWHRPRPIRTAIDFSTPIGQSDTLHGALDRLLERALGRPERRGRSVQGLRLAARLEGGGSWGVEAVLKEPTSERARLGFVLKNKMALSSPPRAVETLIVEFFEFGAPASQAELFARRETTGRAAEGHGLAAGEVPQGLREAVRELKLKIGFSPLFRVVEVDPWSRLPERRHALLEFDP
ncbi:MAG: DNA polymerase Y family protein [Gemmatimonadota bacterium]